MAVRAIVEVDAFSLGRAEVFVTDRALHGFAPFGTTGMRSSKGLDETCHPAEDPFLLCSTAIAAQSGRRVL
jgi:hypothetical protein